MCFLFNWATPTGNWGYHHTWKCATKNHLQHLLVEQRHHPCSPLNPPCEKNHFFTQKDAKKSTSIDWANKKANRTWHLLRGAWKWQCFAWWGSSRRRALRLQHQPPVGTQYCTALHCTAALLLAAQAHQGERAAAAWWPSMQELAQAQHGVHHHDELEQERQVLRELHAQRVQRLAEKEQRQTWSEKWEKY